MGCRALSVDLTGANENSITAISPLISPRPAHASAVVGNALFVIIGMSNGVLLPTIERAMIGIDGSLSTFSTLSGIRPVSPRRDHTATVVGNSLYMLGGNVDLLNSIEHTSLR